MAISAGYVVKETATNVRRNVFTSLAAVVTIAVVAIHWASHH